LGCLFFGQNGGDGFLQEEQSRIPQLFHIFLWIGRKSFDNYLFWLGNLQKDVTKHAECRVSVKGDKALVQEWWEWSNEITVE
jgi:hypothetical protein